MTRKEFLHAAVGSTVRGSAIVRNSIKASGAQSDATVLGLERITATAAHAALANGASGHAMDYDDAQLSTTPDRAFGLLTHPTVPALPGALSRRAERRRLPNIRTRDR